jgi:hypothetical protein
MLCCVVFVSFVYVHLHICVKERECVGGREKIVHRLLCVHHCFCLKICRNLSQLYCYSLLDCV